MGLFCFRYHERMQSRDVVERPNRSSGPKCSLRSKRPLRSRKLSPLICTLYIQVLRNARYFVPLCLISLRARKVPFKSTLCSEPLGSSCSGIFNFPRKHRTLAVRAGTAINSSNLEEDSAQRTRAKLASRIISVINSNPKSSQRDEKTLSVGATSFLIG